MVAGSPESLSRLEVATPQWVERVGVRLHLHGAPDGDIGGVNQPNDIRTRLLRMRTVAFNRSITPSAKGSPVQPPSTSTLSTDSRFGLHRSMAAKAPLRSVTSAVVTATAWGKPCVSTAICRLMPASYPFSSAVSVFLTLCASTIMKLVAALRPSFSRASPTDFF